MKSLWYGIHNHDDDYLKHDRNQPTIPPQHSIINQDIELLCGVCDDTENEILTDLWLTRIAKYRLELLKRTL